MAEHVVLVMGFSTKPDILQLFEFIGPEGEEAQISYTDSETGVYVACSFSAHAQQVLSKLSDRKHKGDAL